MKLFNCLVVISLLATVALAEVRNESYEEEFENGIFDKIIAWIYPRAPATPTGQFNRIVDKNLKKK